MPLRHLGRGVTDHVGHDPHARAPGIDVFLLRLVLLQDLVLDRADQVGLGDAALFADGDVHRQQCGGETVDRHRRGDRAEVDVGVEILHVAEGVGGDASAADLA